MALGRWAEAGKAIETGLAAAIAQGLPFDQALLLEARGDLRASTGASGGPEDSAEAARLLASLGVTGRRG